MLRSKIGELWRRFVQRRQIVGVDEHMNKYYMCAAPFVHNVCNILLSASIRPYAVLLPTNILHGRV